jgi:hypothetical protein
MYVIANNTLTMDKGVGEGSQVKTIAASGVECRRTQRIKDSS